ncbi:ribokinase-like [Sycon ciliatum]|uniref:ribokinase-like n=1 Tax=Sycon ciliatum TaxID=27933 RepID=UPI0020A84314|eukprot:scpid41301/ scgid0131/ Ribokinase
MEKPDIVVVGSCMKDLVCYVSSFPAPGETVSCHKFETGFGGKGANQCVMAAKLGATAVMVAKVGDDDIGTATLENLSAHNICTDHVQRVTGIASGVASIAVNQSGENTIIIAPGANECMDTAVLDSARDVIQNAKVVVCQLEIPPPTVKAALLLAKQNGVRTIFNPAPAVNGLDETIYSVSDIVCLNETEASMLTEVQVTGVESAQKAAISLLSRDGPGAVVVTLGAQGVVYTERGKPGTHHVAAETVKAVDTTGAGDAFVGALAFFLAKYPSLSLESMIRRSAAIAAVSVQAPGTQTSFPSRAKLQESLFSEQ